MNTRADRRAETALFRTCSSARCNGSYVRTQRRKIRVECHTDDTFMRVSSSGLIPSRIQVSSVVLFGDPPRSAWRRWRRPWTMPRGPPAAQRPAPGRNKNRVKTSRFLHLASPQRPSLSNQVALRVPPEGTVCESSANVGLGTYTKGRGVIVSGVVLSEGRNEGGGGQVTSTGKAPSVGERPMRSRMARTSVDRRHLPSSRRTCEIQE